LALLKGHAGPVGHLIIVGEKLISSSTDGTVRVWSLQNYSEVRCIRAHESAITELVCDGNRILSGGTDGSLKIWGMETGELMLELLSGMDAVWKGGFIGDKVVAVYSKSGSAIMEVCNQLVFVTSVKEF
jgi:F-box and WD-40 domain protein CDC4